MKALLLLPFLLLVRVIHSEVTKPTISVKNGEIFFQLPLDKNLTFKTYGTGKILFENNGTYYWKKSQVFHQWHISKDNFDTENMLEIQNGIKDLFKNITQARNVTRYLPSTLDRINIHLRVLNRKVYRELFIIKKNECLTNPCKNNGKCYSLLQGFQCKCTDSWKGNTCEIDVNECTIFSGTDLGCQNNSTCINTIGSYRCICNNGYMGSHCTQLKANCATSPRVELCANGYCVPTKNKFGYSCICEQGWRTDGISPECNVDIDECSEVKNRCHTECINIAGSFKCDPCPPGYSGNGVTCRDIDECMINNGGCSISPFVNCINTVGSFHCHHCPLGWNGDGKFCTAAKQNECPHSNVCHEKALCKIISNIEICTCQEGWSGHGYGAKGCAQVLTNCPLNCKNNGTCQRINETSARCVCPDGYDANNHCEKIKSICEPSPCLNNGSCEIINNNVNCTCQPGFMGLLCNVVTLNAGCKLTLTQDNGTLNISVSDKNYSYPTCKWHINAQNPDKILELSLKALSAPYSSFNCHEYGLKITDGKSNINLAKFCQFPVSKMETVITSSGSVTIEYRFDQNQLNQQGFVLEWLTNNRKCGGYYDAWKNSQSGIIKSPNSPQKAPPSTTCIWHILAEYGKRIELEFFGITFGDTSRETSNVCGDYIEIFDTDGDSTKKICNSGLHVPVKSDSNEILIKFHTDQFRADSMFQIHYKVVNGICGGYFESTSGTVDVTTDIFNHKDLYDYESLTICRYLIKQPKFYKIKLDVTNVDMQHVIDDCSFHVLEIYDGPTESFPLLSRICKEINFNIISSGQFMLVKFMGPRILRSWNNRLFAFNYKINCDEVHRNPNGIIISPGFPYRPYISGVDCAYDIYAPLKSSISMQFINFSLSSTNENSCNYAVDNIKIDSVWQMFLNSTEKDSLYFCKQPPSEVFTEKNHLRLLLHSVENKNNAPGFMAFYSYFTDISGCGGIFMEPTGKIASYDFNSMILKEKTPCQWIIVAPPNIDIEIKFEKFVMNNQVDCKSYIEIFENSTSQNRLIGKKHCDEMIFEPFIYQSNVVTISLHAGNNYNLIESGFIATYRFVDLRLNCGGVFNAPFGYIKSPHHPGTYPGQVNCTWIIHAPPGHQIELVKIDFELEKMLQQCDADYLEIRNGMSNHSPLIGRFCGTEIPNRIPSFTNHLFITFVSDSSVSKRGFYFKWEQTSTGCGGVINSFAGSIHSPHYPEIFKGAAQCDWTIQVSPASVIQFNITATSSIDSFCLNDKLMVYDGPNANYKIFKLNCTSAESVVLKANSSSNILTVRFVTSVEDESNFLLEYQAICIRSFVDVHHGYIDSPNFPNTYPNDLYCKWTIFNRRSHEITLVFTRLELEISEYDYLYDSLEIFELNNNISSEVKFNKKYPIKSTADSIIILFTTDVSNGASGFHIEFYIEGCGDLLTNKTGDLESPNYPYSTNMYCLWKIEADFGYTIEFNLKKFRMADSTPNCTTNSLTISDSYNYIFTRICENGIRPNQIFTIPGRIIYVKYESDNNTKYEKYFQASYKQKKSVCGGRTYVEDTKISSPNYPNDYQSNLYCEWQLYTTEGSHMEITFLEFDLETSSNCSNDYLEIYDGQQKMPSNLIKRLCGSDRNIEPIKTKGDVYILFRTNNSTESSGWQMHIKKNCGQNIYNKTVGALYSTQDNKEDCIWTITAPNNNEHVFLEVLSMNCSCDNLNSADCEKIRGLTIYDGDSTSSPKKMHICRDSFFETIISNGNSLTILGKQAYYRLSYYITENGCGGSLFGSKGRFSSPLYPGSYPLNVECVWTIKAFKGMYLELNFISIDIPESTDCNDDYLILKTDYYADNNLGIFCGNKLPNRLRIYEQVYVIFQTTSVNVGKGFLIEYNFAHHNELEENDNFKGGNITFPSTNFIKNDELPYSWRISVSETKFILLKFHKYTDGLIIYDGFDNTAPRISLNIAPSLKTSTTNVIYMVTDNEKLSVFQIEWKSFSYWEKRSLTSSENDLILLINSTYYNISSPGYPQVYANNLNTTWILKPQFLPTYVKLSIYSVDIELSRKCYADKLEIESSSDLIEWNREQLICEEKQYKKPLQISGKPYLRITFTSDQSDGGIGFTALAKAVCGNQMTEPHGVINKNDVREYLIDNEQNRTCEWSIQVTAGKQIEFEIEFQKKFDGESPKCENSYGSIYDGLNKDAINLICFPFNNTIRTTSNLAYIRYYGNDITWDLYYREYSECGYEIDLTESNDNIKINSSNYRNNSIVNALHCKWIVTAPVGKSVEIYFLKPFNPSKSSKENIELRDGGSLFSKVIGKYVYLDPFIRLKSSGNVLMINYFADVKEFISDFIATVYISTCGGTFTNPRGTITSENYPTPGGYTLRHRFCEYHIKMPKSYGLRIKFDDVDLPFYNKLELDQNDNIEILNVENFENSFNLTKIKTITGNDTEITSFDFATNEIIIRLQSFITNNKYRGFKISYTRISELQCNQEISSQFGQLTFLNDNQSQKIFMKCYWRIIVPKEYKISAQIVEFENNDLNQRSVIEIANDPYMKSIIFKCELKTCDRSKFSNLSSTDNKMFIRFSNKIQKLRRLKIQYNAIDTSWCPKINGIEGPVNFPLMLLEKPFYCEAETPILHDNETFALYLTSIQTDYIMSSRTYKPYKDRVSFLEIYIGNFIESQFETILFKKLVYKYEISNEVIALPFERTVFKFLKTEGIKIFKTNINYKIHPCGGRRVFDNDFLINTTTEFNQFASNYGQLDCSWFITLNKMTLMKLQFIYKFNSDCDKEYIIISEYDSDMEKEHDEIKLCSSLDQMQNSSNDLDAKNDIFVKYSFVYVHYHNIEYNPNSKFAIVGIEESKPCGGILMPNSTLNFSRKYYKNNLNCVWYYRTKYEEFSVAIEFIYTFFIEDSKNCEKDFLQIRYKRNSIWFDSQKYCSRTRPFTLNETDVNEIEIMFHSDQDRVGDGFNIKLTDHCNQNITIDNDAFKAITVPKSYGQQKIKCNYNITSQSPDEIIELAIIHQYDTNKELNNQINQDQNLSEDFEDNFSSRNCRKSMIKVYSREENKLNELETICKLGYYENNARMHGFDDFRGQNFYMVSYESSLQHPLTIRIAYRIDRCNANITESGTNIVSPTTTNFINETNNYLKKMNCMWNITAPEDKEILVKFKYFDFEGENYGCAHDFLIAYNGNYNMSKSNQIAMLCGNLTGKQPIIKISNNTGLIYMKSSRTVSSLNKFRAQIYFVRKCDHTYEITDLNNGLTVGVYEDNKTQSYECHLLFKTNLLKYKLKLKFETFDVPKCSRPYKNQNSCDCNYIEMFDSNNIYQNQIGNRYCNLELPPNEIQTIGTNLLIRLVSKPSTKINFTLRAEAILSECGEQTVIIEKDYVLKSPNFDQGAYPSNFKCKWYIYANYSYVIHFEKFELEGISENNSIGICNDYLKISYPVENKAYPKSSHIYCGKQKPNDIQFGHRKFSSKNELIVFEFSSNSLIQKSGFVLNIKRDSYCNTNFSTLSGHLDMLRLEPECKFYFNVPKHYSLAFFIKEFAFNFKWVKELTQILKFYDGASKLLLKEIKYHMYNNYALFFKTNQIIIELHNDFRNISFFIDMYYIASNKGVGCGGTLTDRQGYFTSPSYPKNNRNYTICTWNIDFPTENPIRIKFKEFDLGPKNLCEYNNVVIRETTDVNNEITNRYCGEDEPAEYISKGNKITIEYKRMADFDGVGWYLEYTSDFNSENITNHIIV